MFNSKRIEELEFQVDLLQKAMNEIPDDLIHAKACSKCHHFVNKKYMHDEAKIISTKETIEHEFTCFTCKPKRRIL